MVRRHDVFKRSQQSLPDSCPPHAPPPPRSDPCGKNSGSDDSWGYLNGGGGWEHIACRTYDMTPAEFPGLWHDGFNISRMGVVTTIHLCDLGIEGELQTLKARGRSVVIQTIAGVGPEAPFTQAAFCPFKHLREFDVDGSHLTGPMPHFLAECFPHLVRALYKHCSVVPHQKRTTERANERLAERA